MPWSNNSGWQGGGRGPWSQGPRGGGGQPPDLEDLVRRGQDRLRRILPPEWGGKRGYALAAIALILVWLGSGFYRVQPDEQGVVLRFGAWVNTTRPGLNYHLPYPIETVLTPRVTRVNRTSVGFRHGADGSVRDVPRESLMLTGNQDIVDINFTVFWVIKNAGNYLFNVQDPKATVKAVAESAMRETIGENPLQWILTEGRSVIEQRTRQSMQKILDSYHAGIEITQVNLLKADPPNQVIAAFRDVQAAKTDRDRERNEAEAYRNDVVPRAHGDADRVLQQAEAYKQKVVAEAQGEAARFLALDAQYRAAKSITEKRLYLETMEKVLGSVNKVIIDQKGGPGVVPYLPLPTLAAPSDKTSPPAAGKAGR